MIKAAFIYVAPGQDPEKQNAVIPSEELTLYVVGCSSYDQAETEAKRLVADGIGAIELCAGLAMRELPGSEKQSDRKSRWAR